MNKRILIIGNTTGPEGVKVDIDNYKNFFMSAVGGYWLDTEIDTLENPALDELTQKISDLKDDRLEYLIVYFSGHGSQMRQTILELNEYGEEISASDLIGISKRQLTIYDCCRRYPKSYVFSEDWGIEVRASVEDKMPIRLKYENRIDHADEYQAKLFSCKIGQYSYYTEEGSRYSNNLLKAAQNVVGEFKLVETAHKEAFYSTLKENTEDETQTPSFALPSLASKQQLIISINPDMI